MKTSVTVFLTDLLPERRSFYHKIVKNKTFQNTTVAQGIARLKQSGVEGFELFLPSFTSVADEDIKHVKQLVTKNSMPILSVHQVLRFFTKTRIPEIIRLFVIAKMLDAKVIVLHLGSAGRQIFDKAYVAELLKLQKEYGITIGFENRERFAASYFQPHTWHEKKFVDLLQEKGFSITLDTTHLAHSGGDIVSFAQQHAANLVNIHLSDYKPHILNSSLRPLRFKHLPLGNGNLPIREFLKVLKQQKYDGLITMEIHSNLEGLCKSAEIIASITGTKSIKSTTS
jgi:sugar phosphate isomerase/epimerase